MNKKTIILCIILIAILLAGVAAAVVFLYSGNDSREASAEADLSDSRCGFFAAVPADAVTVMYFSSPGSAVSLMVSEKPALPLLPGGSFHNFLTSLGEADKELGSLRSQQTIISWHFVGGLEPLFVLDLSRSGASPAQAAVVEELASKAGLFCKILDCSETAASGTYLRGRKILIASTSDVLMESSERHVAKGISVVDKDYFALALNTLKGEKTCIFISNESAGKIFEEAFNREYRTYADAVKRMADWTALAVDTSSGSLKLTGALFCGPGVNKFINVFSELSTANVTALGMMPSYAVSAFAMPVSDTKKYIDAYVEFANTKLGRVKYTAEQTRLKKAVGISPSAWAESLNIKELATVSFYAGENLENVLLLRIGNTSAVSGFFGTVTKGQPTIGDYAYQGFTASLFGSLFAAKDESKFAVMDNWAIVGSEAAVNEYTSGKALENTLAGYLTGAGLSPDLKNEHFIGYFSLSEDKRAIDRLFRPKYSSPVKAAFDSVTYAPALLSANVSKGQKRVSLKVDKVELVKSNAPEIERDATVVVENGRYSVKNSGTGQMNTFYQQSNLYLCLSDENGKGLWGVAFKEPICGRAGTVDYFANGKLQILFAAGSKLYLIDRLGRFVNPFPVDLGKEVLLGPDIYDFSGQRKYNVMILHKDNTVEMYNLQGRKPADWKGITFGETIMNLPEEIDVDGKTFWAVRTSLQTLIYPFYGGEPLTSFKGNDKLRPDTKITVVKGGVQAVNYAGKEVTVNLK
ncbi:MAG: hypothetical protein LUC24_05745 [Bacteroidales bacterium]|nr:hypothetical protein [Bacteroidales bacterium]